MKPAIRVEKLSKLYSLGPRQDGNYRTLREAITDAALGPWRRLRRLSRWGAAVGGNGATPPDSLWALKDVDFKVEPGEVVGVIGRNGAGKSTLLKILSQITEPTAGRVELRGRVGSLLEVGTGFHPELTGRENIYLNGAILGMGRREIARKFDEIVAFAETERFLDTPVKRFSSGMYVRLAFAVAAHLELEILLVDEVLAVGDASFQRKCLGKMGDVARGGRTVLVVSHNMGSIITLCQNAAVFENGRLVGYGTAPDQVSKYLATLAEESTVSLKDRVDRSGSGAARIESISYRDHAGKAVDHFMTGQDASIVLAYRSRGMPGNAVFALSIWDQLGRKITHCDNQLSGQMLERLPSEGEVVCFIPKLPLPAGRYALNVALRWRGETADHVFGAALMEVIPGDFFGTGKAPDAETAPVLMPHRWIPG